MTVFMIAFLIMSLVIKTVMVINQKVNMVMVAIMGINPKANTDMVIINLKAKEKMTCNLENDEAVTEVHQNNASGTLTCTEMVMMTKKPQKNQKVRNQKEKEKEKKITTGMAKAKVKAV